MVGNNIVENRVRRVTGTAARSISVSHGVVRRHTFEADRPVGVRERTTAFHKLITELVNPKPASFGISVNAVVRADNDTGFASKHYTLADRFGFRFGPVRIEQPHLLDGRGDRIGNAGKR